MKFYERLKVLRKLNNMTQEELSIKMGVTPAAVGLYEQGRRNPDNETLKKLASIFGVSIDYLLGFEDTNFQNTNKTLSYDGSKDKTISVDEFTYVLCNETKDLTEEQKSLLLSMAKALKGKK